MVAETVLDQFGRGEVLMQAEVEIDVPLQVPGQHGRHHEVGLVDGDQVGHLLVLHVCLELEINHDPVDGGAVV